MKGSYIIDLIEQVDHWNYPIANKHNNSSHFNQKKKHTLEVKDKKFTQMEKSYHTPISLFYYSCIHIY